MLNRTTALALKISEELTKIIYYKRNDRYSTWKRLSLKLVRRILPRA
jgi:hypothetical protein